MRDLQEFLDKELKKVEFENGTAREVAEDDFGTLDTVKDIVSEARENAGLTQKELAAITGLTQSNISNIEKGNNIPTLATLNKIANATGKRLVIDFVDEED